MMKSNRKGILPGLDVTLAGVHFRSPIGLAAIGGSSHFGKEDIDKDCEDEVNIQFVLKHIQAGSSYIYVNISYLTEATLMKLKKKTLPPKKVDSKGRRFISSSASASSRFMKAETLVAPYGVEGLYLIASPMPSTPNIEIEESLILSTKKFIQTIKQKKPSGIPIIGSVLGCGGLPDAYIDGARKCEELGTDLIELNFHCPLQWGMSGSIDNFLQKKFSPFPQGSLLGEHPEIVEEIVREVVKAVKTPVGAKFSAETGFPRIVELARRIKEAGAQYINVGGAAVGIAPPDIYNGGKPLWQFADGNPFCLTSGSWLRRICYRDIAVIAKFVPGLDIAASGGLVRPAHCIEAMMLGATLTQICTGVIEQGRLLMRRSNDFLQKFMTEQGYHCVQDLIGLGQPYIKYSEDCDLMAGQVVCEFDEGKCTRCGHCLDNLCVAIYSDHGKIRVNEEKCAGCGACMIACPSNAFKLVLVSSC
jgi:dihydroorotate dehydrogenase/Pyruvate/2-oxoacid:ferredoxin oxidoreductase delta subunit